MYQQAWMASDRLSRDDIYWAISQAEQMWYDETGSWPAPKYIEGEVIQYPMPVQFSHANSLRIIDGRFKSVRLSCKHVNNVGVQTEEVIEAGLAVTYSDVDGDGIDETWTATTAVAVPTGTTTSEVAVFYTATDRHNADRNVWEIRPVEVSIDSGTGLATITGKRYLMVVPDKMDTLSPDALNVNTAGNFITEIDVYRRYIDPSLAGTLIWENILECDDPPCSFTAQVGCFGIRDKRMGEVTPQAATYDDTNADWDIAYLVKNRTPDRVTINYEAGIPRQANGLMDYSVAKAITMLSVTLLTKRGCGCNAASQTLDEWNMYPGQVMGDKRAFMLSREHINAAWGAKQGAIEAWKIAKRHITWEAASYG